MSVSKTKLVFAGLLAALLIPPLILLIWSTTTDQSDGRETTALIEAVKDDDLEDVDSLLKDGHPVNEKNKAGGTALHYASARNNLEIVRLLLSYGADPLIEDNDKIDSIEINLWNKNNNHYTGVLKLLVTNKEFLDTHRNGGYSYLLASIDPRGSVEKSKFLVEMGDDVNFRGSHSGEFPLLYAAGNGSAELVNFLLSRGADPNMSDFDGETALMAACRNRNAEMVELLLARGANKLAADKSGATAIDFLPAGANEIAERLKK